MRLSRDGTSFECFALVGFFSCRVVYYAEQITEATSQRGFFRCLTGRFRNSENKGELAGTGTALNYLATIGRRSAFRKKCKRGNHRRHWVRVFRARWRFSSGRVVFYSEQITDATSQRGFFRCLTGRFRNSENRGDSAEIATSLNQIATIGRRSALRKKRNRAKNRRNLVRAFRARWRVFSVRVVNYAKEITVVTLPAWQPVEMSLPLLAFSPPTWSLPPEEQLGRLRLNGASPGFFVRDRFFARVWPSPPGK